MDLEFAAIAMRNLSSIDLLMLGCIYYMVKILTSDRKIPVVNARLVIHAIIGFGFAAFIFRVVTWLHDNTPLFG